MKLIGRVVGQPSPYRVSFTSKEEVRVGQYVVVKDRSRKYLGIVSSVYSLNPYLSGEIIEAPDEISKLYEMSQDIVSYRAEVDILGSIGTQGTLESSKIPPLPNSEVLEVDSKTLHNLFSRGNDPRMARIGTLLNTDIPVYINIEQAVVRHLSILAVTGGGKSNTVGVLLERLHERNATVVIFDMHGEYVNLSGMRMNRIEPKFDPFSLDTDELAGLIGIDMDTAAQMYYILSEIKEELDASLSPESDEFDEHLRRNTDYIGELLESLKTILEDREKLRAYDKGSIFRLMNRLKVLKKRYGTLFEAGATHILKRIKLSSINVIDLSNLDEDKADVVVAHTLSNILNDRKSKGNYLKKPVVCILEEAHVFASKNLRRRAKYILGRIAREGRKFGVGLWLVSQRPKALDQDILSQMNNMIILKLVEPEDQKHVQSASEILSGELMKYLPALNPGEAIVLGNMVSVPLLVKIDIAKNKPSGQDPKVISEWLDRYVGRTTEKAPL